jgi:glycosyltransferase involved in cell wall biosynthesis
MNKTMHVITTSKTGGAELMLKRLLLECINNNSHKQILVILKGYGVIESDLSAQGVKVFNLNITSLFTIPKDLYKLVRLIKLEKPDAVFTWLYHADLFGGIAAYLAGVNNIIWGIRCTHIQQGISLTSIIRKICSKLSYFIPRTIICCAHSTHDAHEKLGYCLKKMVVVPNGYNLNEFNPDQDIKNKIKNKLGLDEGSKIIGTVGRFDPLKDFENFIKASSLVAKEIDNVYFFMAGKGLDAQNAQLMSWINKEKISDKVFLFGEVNSHDIYSAIDLYCLSSKSEGFPNVVAEAMMMKIPCIATDVGDAKVIVNNIGKVVPPNNSYALSEAMINMLRKPDSELIKMGSEARQSITNNYNITKIAQEFIRLSYHNN